MRREEEKKRAESNKYKLFCPHCRRPTLKPNPHRSYSCGFCGLTKWNEKEVWKNDKRRR